MTLVRVRALLVVATLAALAVAVVTWAILRDSQTREDPRAGRTCTQGEVRAKIAIPEPKDLAVNVLNDTDQPGLAKQVADKLRSRDFKVKKVGNDKQPEPVKGTAELRFGPKTVGGAHLLTAYFIDADLVPDPNRKDASVDIVLGQEFRQVATPSEVNDALRLLEDPSPPAGMC